MWFLIKINEAYSSFVFFYNTNLSIAISFQPYLCLPHFLRSRGRSSEPYPLVRYFKLLFCLVYLFLVVLVCLFVVVLGPDVCVTLEGAR